MESSKGSEVPNGSFDEYMTRLSKHSQQLSQQIETILKQQQHNPTSDDEESYTTATPSPPIPQQTYRRHRGRISSPESEGQDEPEWRVAHRPQYHRSHSVPSMKAPRYYSPDDETESSISEASHTGSEGSSDDEESGGQSGTEEGYDRRQQQQQLVQRRESWDPMQPAPFEARIQHYDRHPHMRTHSGPSSAGPMLQRHPTVTYTQPPPPPPGMMFADPMNADMAMVADMGMVNVHPPILFGPPPPPPHPPMGVPHEFMGITNDSGIMSTAMMADTSMLDGPHMHEGPPMLDGPMLDRPMLDGPMLDGPMHEMLQFEGPTIEHYQSAESKPPTQPLPRHQRMVVAIKQKLGRAYEKRSIRYSMISQRMYEQGQEVVDAGGASGLSRQSSLGRRRSVRRNASQNMRTAPGMDKPDTMMWCFRRQRRLASPAWEPFDGVNQLKLMDAASQNKQCMLQDSHFPQMINVVPSDGYGISRKMYGHVIYNVALLDPTKQTRTFMYCIPLGRRTSTHIDTDW